MRLMITLMLASMVTASVYASEASPCVEKCYKESCIHVEGWEKKSQCLTQCKANCNLINGGSGAGSDTAPPSSSAAPAIKP